MSMRKAKEQLTGRTGQSLIEVLVALSIFVITAAAAFSIFFGGQSLSVDAINAELAADYAGEGMVAVRSIKDDGWSNLSPGTHGLIFSNGIWQFSGASDTKNGLTRTVLVADIDSKTKEIKTTVTWSTDPLRVQSTELVERLTDWRGAQYLADTGCGGLSGNWGNPRTLGSVDLGPGNSATDLDVINKMVYMSAEASAVNKPDFFIVDATNGESPIIKSSINVGSKGLNSLDVGGSYAYGANQSGTAHLLVINVTSSTTPSVTASYRLPGITENDTHGKTLFYYNSKVYIGTNEDSGGKEFHVVDVSNPSSPVSLGSYEINDNVNDIFVSGTRAYLGTDLGNAGLIILDISNPSSPSLLGQTYSTDVKSVANYSTSLALLGPGQEFRVSNVGNPGSITTVGSINVGDVLNDIIPGDNLAFVATSNSNREFQVINMADPANLTLYSYLNFSQIGSGIDCEGNIVYMAVRSNDALRIITSQ